MTMNIKRKKTLTDAHVIMHIVYNIQVSIKGECQVSSIFLYYQQPFMFVWVCVVTPRKFYKPPTTLIYVIYVKEIRFQLE